MTDSRSPAVRRALGWCLCIGSLAVALGVVQWILPFSFVSEWNDLDVLSFWTVAGIAALDVVLIAIGSRAPDSDRPGIRWVLWVVLVLAVLAALGEAYLKYRLDYPHFRPSLLLLLGVTCGVIVAVQWLSLRTLEKRV